MSARLVGLVALLCVACRSDEPWTFGFSRAFYEDGAIEGMFENGSGDMDPAAVCLAPVLLALPIVLDVLFFPVALPRDLVVHGAPGG